MAERAAQDTEARPRVVAGLRLLARVGSGGEGEVWEARDADGGRRALKLIRPEFLPSPDELTRRGAYLRRIDHPALVRVHRTGRLQGSSLDGWGFLEMDFVDGEPLGRAPADPEALERLEPLAEALDALHRGEWSDGIPLVHRDVKPANLISRPDGTVVLVDCSTLRGTDATHLTRVGTPVFAAPEVMTGRVGPPADVYSFGATIVALVTGARGDALAVMLAEPEHLDLPEPVGRALSPDPAARPASCRAVLDAGADIDPDLLPPLPSRYDWDGGDHDPAQVDAVPVDGSAPDAWYGDGAVPAVWQGDRSSPDPWHPEAPGPPPKLLSWVLVMLAAAGLAWGAIGERAVTARLVALVAPGVPVEVWASAAVLAAVLVHVFAVRLAGEGWGMVALPPAGWAWLLGERASPPGAHRAWVRTALVGSLTAGLAAALAIVLWPDAPPELRAAVPGAGLVSVAAVAGGRARGILALLLRLVIAPVWAIGVVLLVAAAVLAAPVAAVRGRVRGCGRLVTGALMSVGVLLGLGARPRYRQPPDPRA